MMRRVLRPREWRILLLVSAMALLTVYYLAIFQPTQQAIQAAQTQLEELESLHFVEATRAWRMAQMEAELAQLEEGSTPAILPRYDNFKNLLEVLNESLQPADDYRLNFLPPNRVENIIQRGLQLEFDAQNYDEARNILAALYTGPFRCQVTSFRLLPQSPDGDLMHDPVSVMMDLIYFEME